MPIVSSKKIDECKEEVIFSYESDKVNKIVDDVAREIGKKYKIPGNRPGRASLDAIKLSSRKLVLDNALNQLLNEGFQDILFENKWKPFSQPQVIDSNITFNSFSAKYIIGYIPEVTLKQYKDIEMDEPKNLPNKDTLVEKLIESVCTTYADQKPFSEDDFLLMGDTAIINFEGKIDGKDFEKNKGEGVIIEIGKGNTITGFEDNLIGMKLGEKRGFELSFDDKSPVKEFINKTVNFSVEVISAMRKEPVAFDEELAKKLKFDNLDKLKEDVAKKAEEYKKEMLFNSLKLNVINKLLELNEINVPDWMVASTAVTSAQIQNKKFDALTIEEKENLISETKRNIKLAFILDKVKELEIETVLSEQELMKILDNNIGKLPENIRKELIEGKNYALYSKLLNDIQTEYVLRWVSDHAKLITKAEVIEEGEKQNG